MAAKNPRRKPGSRQFPRELTPPRRVPPRSRNGTPNLAANPPPAPPGPPDPHRAPGPVRFGEGGLFADPDAKRAAIDAMLGKLPESISLPTDKDAMRSAVAQLLAQAFGLTGDYGSPRDVRLALMEGGDRKDALYYRNLLNTIFQRAGVQPPGALPRDAEGRRLGAGANAGQGQAAPPGQQFGGERARPVNDLNPFPSGAAPQFPGSQVGQTGPLPFTPGGGGGMPPFPAPPGSPGAPPQFPPQFPPRGRPPYQPGPQPLPFPRVQPPQPQPVPQPAPRPVPPGFRRG